MNPQQKFSPATGVAVAESPVGGVWNELLDAQGRVRPCWAEMSAIIQRWTPDERVSGQQNPTIHRRGISRRLRDHIRFRPINHQHHQV